jgi:PAS domain S-box-containing protein
MITGCRISLWIILLTFACIFAGIPAAALTDQPAGEGDIITVVMDNNYPPFSFRDASGNLAGVSVDMWHLWETQTGKKVRITGLKWDDALQRMNAGEFDVIDTVFYSDDRAKLYDFSPSYADIDVVIFFNATIPGISGLESLDGFVVGMHKGDSLVEDVRKEGVVVREYPSYEEVVKAAKDGEIVVFILDKPGGVYYLYSQGVQNQFRYTASIFQGALHRAVRKGDTVLLHEITTGFAAIPANEYDALNKKWYGTTVVNNGYLQTIAGVIAVAGFILLILLVILNLTLKRTIAQKTAELNAELDQRRRAEAALRENEKFLDNIIENIPDMVFVKDATELRFVRFNRAGEELLGYPREDLYGKNDYDFFPKEEADFFTAKDRMVIRDRVLVEIPEEPIQTRFMGLRILHTKKIPIYDDDGTPLFVLGISSDITESIRAGEALNRATRKLGFLNAITFTDIQNALFSLSGFMELEKLGTADEKTQEYQQKQEQIIRTISSALRFAKNYRDMGLKSPAWQDVNRTFLIGISHIDTSNLVRKLPVESFEIYADPLLERVFSTLAENVLLHSVTATEIALSYRETPEGLVLVFEDDGVGIPASMKEKIFERRYEDKKGVGLFLAREILSITGITIQETGTEGKGARFEMTVPKGMFRFYRSS